MIMPSALVVDDDPQVRALFCLMLEFGGYEVEAAVDGDDALAKIQQRAFDVVVTDHGMPKMTGLQLARACKALAPTVPIFLVTGWDLVLTAADLDYWGIRQAFAKPIDTAILLAAVDQAVGRA
jgi:CheY-like chemotaxis protein